MIYRVGDQDNPSYDYSRLKPTQVSGDGEKFSLDHRKDENFSSQKKEKGEDKKLHEKTPGAKPKERSGVRLELSGSGVKSVSAEKKNTGDLITAADSAGMFWNSVRKTFRKLAQYAKELLDKIWNDPPPQAESVDVTPEEAERYTQEYYALKGEASREERQTKTHAPAEPAEVTNTVNRDVEIQKYLRSGNLDQVLKLLTDNGKRSIAKNSTLLTYYDKSGRLTPVNPSDSERILHGERHTQSL